MKKLSNITESVWADIHRRSNGTQVRKEDDINGMDPDRFWDYLRLDLYKTTTSMYEIRFYTIPYDSIMIPISINSMHSSSSVTYVALEGFNDPKGMVVTMDNRSIHRLPDDVSETLDKMYSIGYVRETSKRQGHIIIKPKDGSPVTNTFFIEVVDFLLDNIKDSFNPLVKKI